MFVNIFLRLLNIYIYIFASFGNIFWKKSAKVFCPFFGVRTLYYSRGGHRAFYDPI